MNCVLMDPHWQLSRTTPHHCNIPRQFRGLDDVGAVVIVVVVASLREVIARPQTLPSPISNLSPLVTAGDSWKGFFSGYGYVLNAVSPIWRQDETR